MKKRTDSSSSDRRPQLNILVTPELREKIQAAANAAGRSITKELEMRLENSFSRDQVIELLLGGTQNGRLLEKLAAIIRDGGEWRGNRPAFDAVAKDIADAVAAEAVFDTIK
ncbi:MAG: Arc family DNA-binding protein [Pseudolabrys sp.]|nr:Arc family DNA-binding protein [Pseudolabrys sp.]